MTNLFTFAPLLDVIQLAIIWLSRVYVFASEVFTITAILWALKLGSDVCEKLYNATRFMFKMGVYVGTWYYNYAHETVLTVLYSVLINTVRVCAYTAGLITRTIRERREIVAVLNTHRNTVGSWFVYTSPVLG